MPHPPLKDPAAIATLAACVLALLLPGRPTDAAPPAGRAPSVPDTAWSAGSVEPAGTFHPAEPARQDYRRRYPERYRAWHRVPGRERAPRDLRREPGKAATAGKAGKAGRGSAGRTAGPGRPGQDAPHASASRRDSQ